MISAAIRRGLIEAVLQHPRRHVLVDLISAAIRRGLIEAEPCRRPWPRPAPGFPRPFAAASLKRREARVGRRRREGFPRPFAAASLKRAARPARRTRGGWISAAIRRGLIEASCDEGRQIAVVSDFRGHSPRPH